MSIIRSKWADWCMCQVHEHTKHHVFTFSVSMFGYDRHQIAGVFNPSEDGINKAVFAETKDV